MANRNDVATAAGVSGATVSRVFNFPDTVSEETRNRVMEAARSLGYHPNIIASNFVRKRSGNIGVVIPKIPNVHIFSVYYFSELLSGIGEGLSEKGYDLLLFFNSYSNGRDTDYTSFFKGGKVDGCVLLGTRNDDNGLTALQKQDYKFCLINNYIKGSDISYADVDNVFGSFKVIEHFINTGHTKIAFLNGPKYYTNSTDRFAGYAKALYEHNIPLKKEYVIEGNYGRKSGYEAAGKFLALKELPTAIFAANDRMAAGLLQGLKERGVRVPEEMAIAGYDDSDIATLTDPQLTTVRIPFYDMGKSCVREFIRRIENNGTESFNISINPELVIRKSSKSKTI